MKPYQYRSLLLIIILISASLSCQLVSGIGETQATLEAAATQASEGITSLGTGQALLTEVGDSDLLETAQALVTQGSDSGLLKTAMAAATQGPGIQETAQASMGEPPEDIPIIPGSKDEYLTSEFTISYSIAMAFSEVVEFYERDMPINGWTKDDQNSMKSDYVAALIFSKGDRSATVTLNLNPLNNQTIVVILLSNN